MIYPIRSFGDPVLRMPATPVKDIDAGVRRLVDDMIETMYDAPGVGLAAPQIGVPRAVVVFDIQDGEGAQVSSTPIWSRPRGSSSTTKAAFRCRATSGRSFVRDLPEPRGLDLDGKEVEYAGDELIGRVLQHEIDHLPRPPPARAPRQQDSQTGLEGTSQRRPGSGRSRVSRPPIRAVFLGTPEAAVPTLVALTQAAEVVAVITRPDKPRGRSARPVPSPVKAEMPPNWASRFSNLAMPPSSAKCSDRSVHSTSE